MDWKQYKADLLRDPEFAREYAKLEPEYKLAHALIRGRLQKGLTQEELARRTKTKQSAIARLEAGQANPSLRVLAKLAEALDAELVVQFEPRRRKSFMVAEERAKYRVKKRD